jgi:HAD superfamily hydrolase (TIGR01450 family)
MSGFGATELPLAAVHDVALLDLDGVVYVGPHAVPHAAESLDAALERFGMRSAFVTNNASRPPAVVAEHLVALGVHAGAADVVTSAQAGARVLAESLSAGARVLAVGGPGVAEALRERGFVPVASADDDPAAVMQGYGPDVGWRALAEASLAIDRGVLWVATNLDRTIPSPRGRVIGNGSLVMALQHATGAVPVVAGKPEPPLMRESVERTHAERPLVVGDRLDTDIEGATRSGLPSLLVLTGVTDWHDLLGAPPAHRPTYLDLDLRALLRPAPAVHVDVEGAELVGRCGAAGLRVAVAERPAVAAAPAVGGAAMDPGGVDWLPGELRDLGRGGVPAGERLDVDLVRAVVAVAWAARDRGIGIAAVATIEAAG